MAVVVGWFGCYSAMVIHTSPMANDFTAPVALFLLFLIPLLINVPLRVIRPSAMLGTGELTTIYVMMLTAAAIPARGFIQFLGPVVTSAQYYASPENRWGTLIAPHVLKQSWIVPKGPDVIRAYYEGLPRGAPVPWGPWLAPLSWWLAMCLALSMAMVCIAVILRKQWIDNERLVYPLMKAPMELVRQDAARSSRKPRTLGPLWRSPVFWLGFALPFFMFSLRGLHFYFPALFPSISPYTGLRIWQRSASITLRFSPICIGLLYFVRRDILMGLWVFPLLLQVLFGYLIMIGRLPMNPPKLGAWSPDTAKAFAGAGVMAVYVGCFLYAGRAHLRDVLANAFTTKKRVDDSRELISYRAAVFGLLLSWAFMWGWLCKAGMSWWQAGVFLVIAFGLYLGLTRVIAEAGLPVAKASFVAQDFMAGAVGSAAFSAKNLVAFGFVYPFHAEMRCSLLAHCSNGLKMTHETLRSPRRLLLAGMVLAVILSFVAAAWVMIYYPYREGGLDLYKFAFQSGGTYCWRDNAPRIEANMQGRGAPIWKGYPWMVGGAVLMGLVYFAMRRFPGWPLHPAGMFVSFHWCGQALLASALVVWVTKGLIMKWGGARLYKRGEPVFLGLIVGEVVAAGTWAIVNCITGVHTPRISSFY